MSSGPGKIDRVSADTAADFQDFFTFPFTKLGKLRDMRFNQVLTFFYFIKVTFSTDFCRRVENVARSRVPIISHLSNRNLLKCCFKLRSQPAVHLNTSCTFYTCERFYKNHGYVSYYNWKETSYFNYSNKFWLME